MRKKQDKSCGFEWVRIMSYQIENRKKVFTAEPLEELLPKPHIHSHVELIYMVKGKSVATLDNRTYMLKEGDCFLAFPNQIHFYHDQEAVEAYLIIFSSELFKELRNVFQNKMPTNPVFRIGESANSMCQIFEKICSKLQSGNSFDEVVAKGCLMTFLGEAFAVITLEDNRGDEDTTKRILAYCLENYTRPITLEMLAKELYLNKYYISHVFHERMQMSFKEFVNKLRVEHSCGLLEKGCSIIDIAYASGFSSVRTYNRAFLKYMEMSPREYMKGKNVSRQLNK